MNILKPYPDELLYSYFGRMYARSGLLTYRDMADYLYVNLYHTPDMLFTNILTKKALEDLQQIRPYREWILENTMYPCFSRFLPIYRQEQVLQSFIRQDGKGRNLLGLPNMAREPLRYCPICVSEDKKKYGETYWHRVSQLPNIKVCPKHRCYLKETNILIGMQQSPKFYVAEVEITNTNANECTDRVLIDLAEYMVEIFERQEPIQIIPVFQSALKQSEYRLSVSNKVKKLQQDIWNKYEIDISSTTINRVAVGKVHLWYEICVLLHFLQADLSVSDNDCYNTISGSTKQKIYAEVSKKLDVEYSLVQDIGREILKLYGWQQKTEHPGGVRKFDYSLIDKDLQSKVRKKCKEIYDRPAKVTKSLVARELGLPQKRIEKLPKSLEIVQSFEESQEVYWCRLLEQTITELEQQKVAYSWRTIRDSTNIRRKNIIRTLPFMDAELKEKMVDLLKIDVK